MGCRRASHGPGRVDVHAHPISKHPMLSNLYLHALVQATCTCRNCPGQILICNNWCKQISNPPRPSRPHSGRVEAWNGRSNKANKDVQRANQQDQRPSQQSQQRFPTAQPTRPTAIPTARFIIVTIVTTNQHVCASLVLSYKSLKL